ncbi:MAG: creatininase family protein [Chloroflexi bacterium]|nr:creatininase family protein [Chloroflexota bacterium]
MLMENMNWMQVEEYLKKDDRVVLVTGSMEEHGYNTVATDTQTAWEVAKAACEKTGVLMAPSVNYGFADWANAFPGTISIRPQTFMSLINDILRSLMRQGFKRILILNGHGQNEMASYVIEELSAEVPDLNVRLRSWYMLPRAYQIMQSQGTDHWDHASWLESFSWINRPVEVPNKVKPSADLQDYTTYGPQRLRELIGDGTAGGAYTKDEEFMLNYFKTAVEDLVELLENGWGKEMHQRAIG